MPKGEFHYAVDKHSQKNSYRGGVDKIEYK